MNRIALTLAAALSLLGCADFDEPELPGEATARRTDCTSWGCGSNGVVLEDYPVEAVHLDGLPNAAGLQLSAVSAAGVAIAGRPTLQWGPRTHIVRSMPVDVVDGELVAVDPQGNHRPIDDDSIKGAWLLVKRYDQEWTIHIGGVATVPSWVVGEPPVPIYDLRLESIEGEHLCPLAMAWGDDYQTYTGPIEGAGKREVVPWERESHYAMLIRGETYNGFDATVDLTGSAGERWLNFVCSGTALSKMRLLGYDPERTATTADQRQATLKMITAKYCGATSYTVNGTPLWYEHSRLAIEPPPPRSRIGPAEALWNSRGAVCLSHSRLYLRSQRQLLPEDVFLSRVRSECAALGHKLPECYRSLGGPSGDIEWRSVTLDHIH